MIVLESTLGCKQGTLWKAPRNAERDVKDSNAFCKNDFWQLVACKPSVPLPPGKQPIHSKCFFSVRVCCSGFAFVCLFVMPLAMGQHKGEFVTPESGTFLSHEQGRSLTETSH